MAFRRFWVKEGKGSPSSRNMLPKSAASVVTRVHCPHVYARLGITPSSALSLGLHALKHKSKSGGGGGVETTTHVLAE